MAGIPLRTLVAMAETGDKQADALLARFDARALELQAERNETIRLARHDDQSHDGRPTLERDVEGVNGRETRAAERWQATAPSVALEPYGSGIRSIRVSSRRYRTRGYDAAVAAALSAGRTWREWTPMIETDARENGSQSRSRSGLGLAQSYADRLKRYGASGDQS